MFVWNIEKKVVVRSVFVCLFKVITKRANRTYYSEREKHRERERKDGGKINNKREKRCLETTNRVKIIYSASSA